MDDTIVFVVLFELEGEASSEVNVEDTGFSVVLCELEGLNVDIIEAEVELCIVNDDVNFVIDEDKVEVVAGESIKVDSEVFFYYRFVLLVECTKTIFDCIKEWCSSLFEIKSFYLMFPGWKMMLMNKSTCLYILQLVLQGLVFWQILMFSVCWEKKFHWSYMS